MELKKLASVIEPENTVLLFGAGASMPSGAPSVSDLRVRLIERFKISDDNFTLSELASLIEESSGRKPLIEELQNAVKGVRPTGGMLNVPLFKWRSIYTTNYDELVEQAYEKKGEPLRICSSNFDFSTENRRIDDITLYKLHGTISRDISLGSRERMILSLSDYEDAKQYRNHLYAKMQGDMIASSMLVIGQSLADPHLREFVDKILEIKKDCGGTEKVHLLLYSRDENRARLYERKGLDVTFGGIDEFFSELTRKAPATRTVFSSSQDPLSVCPALQPISLDVRHAATLRSNVSLMFNGAPASYGDITEKLTFHRLAVDKIVKAVSERANNVVVVQGPSGIGKTTAIRKALIEISAEGAFCWEHKGDFLFVWQDWIQVNDALQKNGKHGVVFVDNAHSHLKDLNEFLNSLGDTESAITIVCATSRNHWSHRVKSPLFFKRGADVRVGKLEAQEIEGLLSLVETSDKIRPLVEGVFGGFSRYERKRRLEQNCAADNFVCLRNIFAAEQFDQIILREYASLDDGSREIYRHVAALENSGVKVHRQLLIRLLGIEAAGISSALQRLTDIVTEYDIKSREGIFGWRGRHPVIMKIVADYKFNKQDEKLALFESVIEVLNPSYEIEIRTIRDLCNLDTGIPSINSLTNQNRLLQKLISAAPGERVPRHRLVRNFIKENDFEKAETEIRIFESDFGSDGPTHRYKILLNVGRALKSQGILLEDRVVMLKKALSLAKIGIDRYPHNRSIYAAYCEVGLAFLMLTSDSAIYVQAAEALKEAETRIGDPEISRILAQFNRRAASIETTKSEVSFEGENVDFELDET